MDTNRTLSILLCTITALILSVSCGEIIEINTETDSEEVICLNNPFFAISDNLKIPAESILAISPSGSHIIVPVDEGKPIDKSIKGELSYALGEDATPHFDVEVIEEKGNPALRIRCNEDTSLGDNGSLIIKYTSVAGEFTRDLILVCGSKYPMHICRAVDYGTLHAGIQCNVFYLIEDISTNSGKYMALELLSKANSPIGGIYTPNTTKRPGTLHYVQSQQCSIIADVNDGAFVNGVLHSIDSGMAAVDRYDDNYSVSYFDGKGLVYHSTCDAELQKAEDTKLIRCLAPPIINLEGHKCLCYVYRYQGMDGDAYGYDLEIECNDRYRILLCCIGPKCATGLAIPSGEYSADRKTDSAVGCAKYPSIRIIRRQGIGLMDCTDLDSDIETLMVHESRGGTITLTLKLKTTNGSIVTINCNTEITYIDNLSADPLSL